jgi:hypothetical protein
MIRFDPRNPYLVPFREAAPGLRNGDLAQFRSRSLISYLIRVGSLGVHSHSAMIRRNGDDRVDLLEMLEGIGGRATPLKARVDEAPGRIDIFRPNIERWPNLDLYGATWHMRELTGRPYGRLGLLTLAAMRAIGLRFLFHSLAYNTDDESDSDCAPFCSHAVCRAYRIGGGVDPVPRTPDYMVVPAQLTQSLLFDYVFTLTP